MDEWMEEFTDLPKILRYSFSRCLDAFLQLPTEYFWLFPDVAMKWQ